jgi:hypothetical protein
LILGETPKEEVSVESVVEETPVTEENNFNLSFEETPAPVASETPAAPAEDNFSFDL